MRKYITQIRNTIKRNFGVGLGYIWRLERGKKNTQRYHFHLIVNSELESNQLKEIMKYYWDYCQWDKLDEEKSFEELDEGNKAAIYASKYMGKINDEEKESPAQVRNEVKTRLWSCSRDWEKVPKCLQMKFNWDTKIWESKIKENWRDNKGKIDEEINNLIKNGFIVLADNIMQKRYCKYKNIMYEKFWDYFKIEIKSAKNNFNDGQVSDKIKQYLFNNAEIDVECVKESKDLMSEQMRRIYQCFSYNSKILPEVVKKVDDNCRFEVYYDGEKYRWWDRSKSRFINGTYV